MAYYIKFTKVFVATATLILPLFLFSCRMTTEKCRADRIMAEINDPTSNYVLVASHRSDWHSFPENSVAAMQSAIDKGVDIIELDVKMTLDSILVVSHDQTIDRCTTGKGTIADLTYSQICEYYLLDGDGSSGTVTDSLHMPTLREALECCKDKVCVNLDHAWGLYATILELTEQLGVTDQMIIKGANADEMLAEFAKHPHNMFYMDILGLNETSPERISHDIDVAHPRMYEICIGNHAGDSIYKECVSEILSDSARLWINTLWTSLSGPGREDDVAFPKGNPDNVFGAFMDEGVSAFQTNFPGELVEYLESRGRHTLK